MNKGRFFLRILLDSLILSGCFMLVIGFFYMAIKAGIPYQDPPVELQIKYEINMGIGQTLTDLGFVVFVFGGISRIAAAIVWKLKDRKAKKEAQV